MSLSNFDIKNSPYYSFDIYLKKIFNEKVVRIPVNLGFGCPNRDGKLSGEGCIFCNENSFLQAQCLDEFDIGHQIREGIEKNKNRANSFLLYFQAGTSTYCSPDSLIKIYDEIKNINEIRGVSFSTRPDFITKEIAQVFEYFASKYFVMVELGLQSVHDKSLIYLNRNHTYSDFIKAKNLLKMYKIPVHAHVIIGIPNENKAMVIETAKKLSELYVDGVKIHNLEVIKETKLEKMWQNREFQLLSFNEYIDYLISFIENLSQDITITRLLTSSPTALKIAPRWNISSTEFKRIIIRELLSSNSFQGRKRIGQKRKK